ncbi:MAG TPA: hypothetical protein VFN55_17745 [Solirubrobacteraceae bacterium]|nr:hypothetical protein [Solirubrobacteraceae bacterium]
MSERMSHHAPHLSAQPVAESGTVAPDPEDGAWVEAEEVVDGLPVLAEVRAIERVSPTLPAVQAAAAAATGFVAGAATLALVRRHSARKTARVTARRTAGGLPIVGTRSFLVDVHLIAKPRP